LDHYPNARLFGMERKSVLHELLELKKPLDEMILPTLDRFERDSVPLVILERRHVASILGRYCDGDLDRHDVDVGPN
jgi:hypothetical protein